MRFTKNNSKKLNAFEHGFCKSSEMLTECLNLRNEMATAAFGKDCTDGVRFSDVADHYSVLNRVYRFIPGDMIDEFSCECNKADRYIDKLISGREGEKMLFDTLKHLTSLNFRRTNIEINDLVGETDRRTEMDALVVTARKIYIIEVKNPHYDITIDDQGCYLLGGRRYPLADRMRLRARMVSLAAIRAGIPNPKVYKIVVNANSNVHITSNCREIRVCYLDRLISLIDGFTGPDVYDIDQMESLMNEIDNVTTESCYEPSFDVSLLKTGFNHISEALDRRRVTNPMQNIFRYLESIVRKEYSV